MTPHVWPVLRAYEQAIERVQQAGTTVVAPLSGAAASGAMQTASTVAGAVASAMANRELRQPPTPVAHMEELAARQTVANTPARPVPGIEQLTQDSRPIVYRRLQRLTEQVRAISLSWSNLWRVEITETRSGVTPNSAQVGERLELLAEGVSFGSRTLTGETVPIGSAAIDRRGVAQGTAIRMTTRDDADGTLQRWFESKCDQIAKADGTFGYPKDYLMLIRVTRLKRDPHDPGGELLDGLQREFLVIPASCEEEYSRGESQLQTVSLSFDPWNTFGPTNLVAK